MHSTAPCLSKDELVERFAPLVKIIAYHLMATLPASVHIDDLRQNGIVGLLDANARFKSGLGAQFETYAARRVRGAMLDGLRENDWAPRNLRGDHRRINLAISKLEQKNGRPPNEKEIAESLGMMLADFQSLLLKTRGRQLIYLDDMEKPNREDFFARQPGDDPNEPSNILERKDLLQLLKRGIEALPEREKLMMNLRYEQDLNLREIGIILGVTLSRVSQLHTQVVSHLRARLLGRAPAARENKAAHPMEAASPIF